MTIARIIEGHSRELISCTPDCTVRDAARKLADGRIGALPVLEGAWVSGIFSERDLLYCIAREGEAALTRTVAEVMTAPAITVEDTTPVLEALSLMTRRRIRHLPVVSLGRLVDFISIGDLVKYRIGLIEGEAQAMREYITMA
jgi:CBS domain-containing protein